MHTLENVTLNQKGTHMQDTQAGNGADSVLQCNQKL